MAQSGVPQAASGLAIITENPVAFTGDTTNLSPVVPNVSSMAGLRRGQIVAGTGIVVGTRILSIDSPTQLTLDTPATTTATAVALTTAHGMLVSMPVVAEGTGDTFAPMTSATAATSEAIGARVVTATTATTYTVAQEGTRYAAAGTEGSVYFAPATPAVMSTAAPADLSGLWSIAVASQVTATQREVQFSGAARQV